MPDIMEFEPGADVQLVIRHRRGDGHDTIWQGYDEVVNSKETGRIVMGWTVDPVTLKITHKYADVPPELSENPVLLRPELSKVSKTIAPKVMEIQRILVVEDFVSNAVVTTNTISLGETEWLVSEPILEEMPDAQIMVGAKERYILSFTWHYGNERVELASLDDAIPQRKAIENKFGHLNPTGWVITKELFVSEEVNFEWHV